MNKPVFAIGDVHGHYDRLEALLLQETLIEQCPDCGGGGVSGSILEIEKGPEIDQDPETFIVDTRRKCETCYNGYARTEPDDITIIQLGDLGHFGGATGSPTGDRMCYEAADKWLDLILWGNHDRALVDPAHAFAGYTHPGKEVKTMLNRYWAGGKIKMAAAAHGYLLVHAGIHLGSTPRLTSASQYATYLNFLDEDKMEFLRSTDERYRVTEKRFQIIDAIGKARGGLSSQGGVLWMDWNLEVHLRGHPFKYICGHTRQAEVESDQWGNWCIDIGDKDNGRLAGMWITPGFVEHAEVNLNEVEYERA